MFGFLGTKVYPRVGECLDVVPWLNAQGQARVGLSVRVGQREQVPCRLLAVRVPQEEVDQRRRQLHGYARKRKVPLLDERLAWVNWTLLITNAPDERLTRPDALILLQVHWKSNCCSNCGRVISKLVRLEGWVLQRPASRQDRSDQGTAPLVG